MLVDLLKQFKSKKLITLDKFIFRKGVTFKDAKDYATLLKGKPERIDFIPYDSEGNFIENHKPIFKGWSVCDQASSDIKKVAMLQTFGNSYKIYFDTVNGTTIISLEHMIDECKYSDLASFFESNLELE